MIGMLEVKGKKKKNKIDTARFFFLKLNVVLSVYISSFKPGYITLVPSHSALKNLSCGGEEKQLLM